MRLWHAGDTEFGCETACGGVWDCHDSWGDDAGYGSHIGLGSGWWKAMKPAAGRGTNRPFSGPPTKPNELFHSINILLYLVLALCESCVHCVMLSTPQ